MYSEGYDATYLMKKDQIPYDIEFAEINARKDNVTKIFTNILRRTKQK